MATEWTYVLFYLVHLQFTPGLLRVCFFMFICWHIFGDNISINIRLPNDFPICFKHPREGAGRGGMLGGGRIGNSRGKYPE